MNFFEDVFDKLRDDLRKLLGDKNVPQEVHDAAAALVDTAKTQAQEIGAQALADAKADAEKAVSGAEQVLETVDPNATPAGQ